MSLVHVSVHSAQQETHALTFVHGIMVEIQVCLFLLLKNHEDTGISSVSETFSVISLVSFSQCEHLH